MNMKTLNKASGMLTQSVSQELKLKQCLYISPKPEQGLNIYQQISSISNHSSRKIELAEKIKHGDEKAREKMITANLSWW